MNVMQIFDNISDVKVPVLTDGQLYIYVLENAPQGNIKIGRSSNMQQRLQSLSGSNSGGNKITRIAVSEATWLYSLEQMSHQHFEYCRIDGTEWFDGSCVTFDDVVTYIDGLFMQSDYEKCNQVRQRYVQERMV